MDAIVSVILWYFTTESNKSVKTKNEKKNLYRQSETFWR